MGNRKKKKERGKVCVNEKEGVFWCWWWLWDEVRLRNTARGCMQ